LIRLLRWLSTWLPEPRVIMDRDGTTPYLARWYLVGEQPVVNRHGSPVGADVASRRPQVYLHRFFRSDHDGELHSHPWKWAVAIILAGGYREERRFLDRVISLERRPGSVVVLRGDDFHRVDLIEDESWSLFIVGPKDRSWFFWNRITRMRAPWRSFLAWKQDGTAVADWTHDARGGS
jgi:hypothetical protein